MALLAGYHELAELTILEITTTLAAPLLQALVLKSQIQGTLVLVSLTNDWANQCVVDYALLQTKEHHNNKDPSLAQQVEAQWKEFIAEFNQRAQRVWRSLNFKPVDTFYKIGTRKAFVIMEGVIENHAILLGDQSAQGNFSSLEP